MIPHMATSTAPFQLSVTLGTASFSASGDATLVLQTFAEFKELAATPNVSRAKPQQSVEQPESKHDAEVKRSTTLPLKPYLSNYKLPGNKHKTAAVLAWSAESNGKRALTLAELEALWKRTSFKMPKNLGRDVRAAREEGWLDSEGTGRAELFSINGFGEDAVSGAR